MAKGTGIDPVADELYALPLDQFTPARTRLEKQARDAGDRELAAQIRALRKPNAAAWLLNQLAREHAGDLKPLIALGAELRAATQALAGDRLRDLSKQQQAMVTGLLRKARELAAGHGQTVSETASRGVQETLHAVLVDEQAAAELLAGRLTDTLHRSGLGDGTAVPAKAPPAKATKATKTTKATKATKATKQPARSTPAAKRTDSKAERALADATKARDAAMERAAAADEAAEAARQEVERLRAELEQARAAATDAEKRRREAAGTLRRAERALDDVQRRNRAR